VWLYFLKNNYPIYANVKIVKQQLTSLPTNDFILDQLRHINKLAVNPLSNPIPHLRDPIVAKPLKHDFNDNI